MPRTRRQDKFNKRSQFMIEREPLVRPHTGFTMHDEGGLLSGSVRVAEGEYRYVIGSCSLRLLVLLSTVLCMIPISSKNHCGSVKRGK